MDVRFLKLLALSLGLGLLMGAVMFAIHRNDALHELISADPASLPAAVDIPGHQRIDLGDVVPGTVVEKLCTITNVNPYALEKPKVVTNCGCVVADITHQQFPPGSKIDIPVRFTAPMTAFSQWGQQQISVDFEEPVPTHYEIVLEYRTLPALAANATNLDFGTLSPGASETRTVKIKFPSPVSRELVECTTSSSHVRVGDPCFNQDSTECEFSVTCTFPQQSSSDHFAGTVLIRRKDLTVTTAVSYSGRVEHPLIVEPLEVMPGFVALGNDIVVLTTIKTGETGAGGNKDGWTVSAVPPGLTCAVDFVTTSASGTSRTASVGIRFNPNVPGANTGIFEISHRPSGTVARIPYAFYAR